MSSKVIYIQLNVVFLAKETQISNTITSNQLKEQKTIIPPASPRKQRKKKKRNITCKYDELERERCKDILKMLESKALSKTMTKVIKEAENNGLKSKQKSETKLVKVNDNNETIPKIKIPRLINGGTRSRFRNNSKLQAEKQIGNVDNELEKNLSFIQKLTRKLQYKTVDSIELDWRIREKLLEFEKVKVEVNGLDEWKDKQERGGVHFFNLN